MAALFEITFLPENRVVQFFGLERSYYELDDGTQVSVQSTPVWCRRCRDVTHGETIQPLETIERQLEETSRRRAEILASDHFPHELGVPYSRDWLEHLRRRLRWRAERRSPPRCIRCGSPDIVFVPRGEPIPHPESTGTIQVDWVGFVDLYYETVYFTPEGDRMARGAAREVE